LIHLAWRKVSRRLPSWPSLAIVGLFSISLLTALWLEQTRQMSLTHGLWHRFTHTPCPLCRGSRAAMALGHGDLLAALWWNPLAVALILGAIAWVVLRWGFGLEPILQGPRHQVRRTLWLSVTALVLLNWVYIWWMSGGTLSSGS